MLEVVDELERAIRQAESRYYRLVVLAAESSSGKTAALQSVARRMACPLLNVNLELSKRMLDLTRAQRSHQVHRLLNDVIAAVTGNVVLLDNLEILFDTGLEVRPLGLLQNLSRNRTIVASWNGGFRDGTLTYAEPAHPEYMKFDQPDAVVITIEAAPHN